MRKSIKNLNNIKAEYKIIISELKSLVLFLFLAILAYVLISNSLYYEGWCQNLLLGLGTGAATSALVSLVFYLNDKQIKIREQIKQRARFMHEFKILHRNIICSINFDFSKDSILDLDSYIKKQHRWYHEYYKRMTADNFTEIETATRKECLVDFISLNLPRFQQMFEYDSEWKKGEYTSWQKTELLSFYNEFKNIQIYINQNNYKAAFLDFAYFLERIKRMSTEFSELSNFNLLKFEYDDNGDMNVDETTFEEKEPDFKFAREFQEIRRNNYKKHYSKESATNIIMNTENME